MMGRQNAPEKLFYRFRLEDYVPFDHPLRQLDAVLKFDRARTVLAGHHSRKGRPSIDPELMLRMLLNASGPCARPGGKESTAATPAS